uniref:Zinc transporter 1 n=1 Tax=Acrobeloides nanus TaxID=290746 RepID=A0A914DCA8_9BILA
MCLSCKSHSHEDPHKDGNETNEIPSNRKNKSHKHHGRKRKSMSNASRLVVMLTMTILFKGLGFFTGYVSHSLELIVYSFYMPSDVMAFGIAYKCTKIAECSTKSNTFGWVRAEVLGALVNGVFLLALCFDIFNESITRIFEPEMIQEPRNVFIVGVIGLLINLIGLTLFHGMGTQQFKKIYLGPSYGGHVHVDRVAKSEKIRTMDAGEISHLVTSHEDRAFTLADREAAEDSVMMEPRKVGGHGGQLNMRAVFLHVLSNAIGSVIVIVTALVSYLVPGYDWLKLYMGPVLSMILVALMIFITFRLVHETALILLQTTPNFLKIEELKEELFKIDGVEAVHEFHIWRLVGERIIATVHIRYRSLRDYINSAEKIRALFHDNSIHSATIEPEFAEMSSDGSINECSVACLPNNCNMTEDDLL